VIARVGHELRLALIALQFLTRVPVPAAVGYEDAWLHASARHFPLVGAVVGAIGASVLLAASLVWPWPVAVLLSIVATLIVTGAFHEDGLADTFDGLGGAVSRERALVIMKDSRLGTYGAVALLAVLALKAATLISLAAEAAAALVLAHTASRALPVLLIRALPYGGDAESAKAKPLAQRVSLAGVVVACAWVVAVALLLVAVGALPASRVALALGAACTVAWAMARWLRRRLQGFTGDTLGAAQQLGEVAIYLALGAHAVA
jgi:adenosylcobinamide-GDP ribazoletransferase